MPQLSISLRNSNRVKYTAYLLALIIFAIIVTLSTHTTFAQSTARTTAKNKSVVGSIIRTNDLARTTAALKANGLHALKVNKLPSGEVLVTIAVSPSNPKAKAVQQALKHNPKFKIATNYAYQPAAMPNDPLLADGSQWNISKVNAPQAWDVTTGSSETTIAIVDSGVLSSQSWPNSSDCAPTQPCTLADFPDEKIWTNIGESGNTFQEGTIPNCTSRNLPIDKSCNNLDDDANGFVDDARGWDFMGGWRGTGATCPNYSDPTTYNDPYYTGYVAADNDPQPYACDSPNHPNELNKHHYDGSCTMFESACYTNHGTAAASAAASASNNGELTAGIDWNAKIMPLRAMDGYGWTDTAHVTAAVEYATAMQADVINISLALFNNGSCSVTDPTLEPALKQAAAAGVVVVAAAGNGGTQGVCYPAKSQYSVAVGASDQADARASFSTYGPELDVIAPGIDLALAIAPSKSSNNYRNYSLTAHGTSFASPQVAGLASLILSTNPTLSAEEVKTVLQRSATKVPAMNGSSFTQQHGHGRIDTHAAVTLDTTTLNLPVYTPLATPTQMKLTTSTQKTDLLTGQLTGPTVSRNQILLFDAQTYINGVHYLRTKADSDAGNHLGIPSSYLRDATTKGGGRK